jgi:GGDEF domain-containing protein
VRCRNYGHVAGTLGGGDAQRVLVDIASALRGGIRGVDHLFRSAPNEFTILLPETDARGCRIVVDRLGAQTGDQLFDAEVQPRPDIRVASVSYPTRRVVDGEALWREAAESLAR